MTREEWDKNAGGRDERERARAGRGL